MVTVIPKRVTAKIKGDFVVFLIGLRINKPWKIHKWLTAARAMPLFGLAKASSIVDASGNLETARGRISS